MREPELPGTRNLRRSRDKVVSRLQATFGVGLPTGQNSCVTRLATKKISTSTPIFVRKVQVKVAP